MPFSVDKNTGIRRDSGAGLGQNLVVNIDKLMTNWWIIYFLKNENKYFLVWNKNGIFKGNCLVQGIFESYCYIIILLYERYLVLLSG